MRLTIGACDFDTELWEYNETPENDLRLSNFSVPSPLDVIRVSIYEIIFNFLHIFK